MFLNHSKGVTTMEKHITLAAVLNIVYRGLAILVAMILVVLAIGFGGLIEYLIDTGALRPHEIPIDVLSIAPLILLIVAVVIVTISIIGIIGAAGVLKRKEWGRILLLVVSFFSLARIPLGTILGIYSIWVLMNDETIKLFNSSSVSQSAATPA
jgi:hypothetical protein